MYQETIDSLKKIQTPATHITSLGKILNMTEDTSLQQLIQTTLTLLQQAHANNKIQGKSTPGNLYNAQHAPIIALIAYCEQFIQAKKPEWQVLAERHGWTPPADQ
ncbi:hypothetical protein RJE46_25110 (plasmid) [Cedecea neteri]|uniref:hypothetical protein n=1 Tax=Cedecea neteri TaxID=158822 RepID=UPI00289368AF|nr:hypothetical protein [Cedecea neteri]WNJ82220.1 hypothetical protein RJE46_25110 [Cedecea neteri]